MKKLCYYAHSKRIYNTAREQRERNFLEKQFNVLCPNKDLGELGGIRPYLERLKLCDVIVCSEYNRHVGRGVFEEVQYALQNKIPVLAMRSKKLLPVKSVNVVNELDWNLYGKVRI